MGGLAHTLAFPTACLTLRKKRQLFPGSLERRLPPSCSRNHNWLPSELCLTCSLCWGRGSLEKRLYHQSYKIPSNLDSENTQISFPSPKVPAIKKTFAELTASQLGAVTW